MQPSILRNLLYSFLAFGLGMGLVFPVYAQFFVDWKEGMQLWFSVGCILAGLTIGLVNYLLCKWVLLRRLSRISQVAHAISNKDLRHQCSLQSQDLVGDIIASFNQMTGNLREIVKQIFLATVELERQTALLGASPTAAAPASPAR